MKKILLVFGTRPEAIKMAPLVHEMKRYPQDFELKVCVTAQHREMLDQVLDLFEISPDYDFDIMKAGQSLSDIVASILSKLSDVVEKDRPDCIVVHGDTSTALASSLVGFFHRIPVAHVEAGLRTGNISSPWPEEFNRRVVGLVTDLHFSPTEASKQNIIRERGANAQVFVTGNTGIDALFYVLHTLLARSDVSKKIREKYDFITKFEKFILITNHRRENFGEKMEGIFYAIADLAKAHPKVGFLFPIHKNPEVQRSSRSVLSGFQNVILTDPLDYLDFVYLMDKCTLIITDSGGIQEEAPSLGKPVILTRDTSERPEAIHAGTVKMVGYDRNVITESVSELLSSPVAYALMSSIKNPYGDGQASKQIAKILKKDLSTFA